MMKQKCENTSIPPGAARSRGGENRVSGHFHRLNDSIEKWKLRLACGADPRFLRIRVFVRILTPSLTNQVSSK
jgi:hypothetical protein